MASPSGPPLRPEFRTIGVLEAHAFQARQRQFGPKLISTHTAQVYSPLLVVAAATLDL